ncbi:GntR family transcriptional regulator [Microbacterium sp. VKM Ac-2923]|uniref:GntR family transcriptional regulator n=1 Tax=Microbacterium sp. VKM Ac-2923 TaxID=2929476 RepID=UPI001FB4B8D7|nr:GntR family transcriptional regulator [Microbacterium sp. VKM Ac-2923]MCJ1706488.1 GntR family transcriptional regulator [Microbacterium sp. VKM Ac-2923]
MPRPGREEPRSGDDLTVPDELAVGPGAVPDQPARGRGSAADALRPGTGAAPDALGPSTARPTAQPSAPDATRAPGPRAADRLADTIRAAILSGDLAPGTPLREEDLSATHGVSRHTARTALARLTAERLATAEPYRGVRVSLLDDDALIALQQLRCALETEALRIVRDRGIRPPDIDDALDALDVAEASGDWPATLAAHARVHLALVDAAGSPRIAEAYRRLDFEMRLLLSHVRPAYFPGALTAEHHTYVEQALADPEHAVRAHLDHSTRSILDSRHGG